MPVYEVCIPAKIIIRVKAETPEQAIAETSALVEDVAVTCPHGLDTKIGLHPGQIFFAEPPEIQRTLGDDVDPYKSAIPTMKEWIDFCLSDRDLTEEEAAELDRISNPKCI